MKSYIDKNFILLLMMAVLTFGSFGVAKSAFNEQINYQGKLTGTNGIAVSNGSYNLRFRLCTALDCAGASDPVWTETLCYSPDNGTTCNGAGTDKRVSITSGLFSVLAGNVSNLSGVNFNQTLYLEVQVGGSGTTPSWETLIPRKKLGAVPAAFEAKQLGGKTWAAPDAIGSGTPAAGSFTTLSAAGLTTVSGGAINLNASSNFNVSIGTGTSAGAITIGNATVSDLALNDAQWSITGPGAATFASISTGSGAIGGGAGSFTTLTSSGNTTLATGSSTANTFGSGASSINTIGSATTPGALTLHGATTLDNTFTVSGSNLTTLGGNLTVAGTAWTATPTISGLITATSGFDSNAASTVAGLTVDGNGNLAVSNGTLSVTAPSTTGNAGAIVANSLTTGSGLDISSASTAGGISGVSKLLNLSRSGVNANTAHTAYGLYSSVTNTNATSGTNIAGYFSASGATTANYGLIVENGNVGIGTTAPAGLVHALDTGGLNFMAERVFAGNAPSALYFRKANGTLPSSRTGVLIDERIGAIVSQGYYGTEGSGGAYGSSIAGIFFHASENYTGAAQGSYITFGTATNGTILRLERMRIDNAGNVGIGNTGPLEKLQVTGNVYLDQASSRLGIGIQALTRTGVYVTPTFTDSATNVYGININATVSNSNALYQGYRAYNTVGAGATITNNYGFYAVNPAGTGAITTNYGLYIEEMTKGSTNYAIYSAGTTDKSYFGGNVGIGDTTPDGKLDIEPTGAVTAASYGINLSNLTTNATTDAINKYGAYITSTGTFTGGAGAATNNYGLYVDTVSGADNNYGAYIAGNVGIGTAAPSVSLHVRKDQNVETDIRVENQTAGTAATANFQAYNNSGSLNEIGITSSSYTPYGALGAGEGFIYSNTTALGLMSDNANGIIKFSTGGNSEKMRIDKNGNIGIGTTVPGTELFAWNAGTIATSVKSSTTQGGVLEMYTSVADAASGNYSGQIDFGATAQSAGNKRTAIIASQVVGATAANRGGNLEFYTKANGGSLALNMIIDNAGNVGIGSTSPAEKLTIRQDNTANLLGIYDGANNTALAINDGGQTTFKPSAFDNEYTFDGALTYADNTTEAKTSGGTAFIILSAEASSNDEFYLGLDHPFNTVYFDIATAGAGITLSAQYYSTTWSALTITDGTANLTTDGTVTFTAPTNWATTVVNGVTKYWMRLRSPATNITTAPTANSASPTTGNRFYVYGQSGDTNPALYVNDKGNVGIGTTAPSALLHARKDQNGPTSILLENQTAGASASTSIQIKNDGGLNNQIGIYSSTSTAYGSIAANDAYLYTDSAGLNLMANNASGIIKFATGGNSEKMRINSSGNVIIGDGTAYGDSRLVIAGTNGSNDSAIVAVKRDGTTNPVFSVLPFDDSVFISAGVYYSNGAWVHNSNDANSQILSMSPYAGIYWFASSNSSVSWNVASAVNLWDTGGIWKNTVQSTATGNSYFTGGSVGIGDITPDGLLDIEPTGAVTAASYGINLSNLTTNITTDAINKYGAYITSTGAFTGSIGTATNNFGLYVDTVSGADNNYGAYIADSVGIGTTAPEGKLHVYSGSAGAVTASGNANQLVLENSATGGISILTPNNAYGTIYFGDGNNNLEGAIQYYHTDNQLQFWTSYITDSHTTAAMVMTNTGKIGINDMTPDGWLDIEPTGATTAASYGINLNNIATNATTDAINKYGAYITSTGTFTGGAGVATNNYGLYVDTVSGADNNYGAYIAGNVGIGTATPGSLLTINQSASTTPATPGTYGIILNDQASARISIGGDASYSYIQSWNSKPLQINSQGNNVAIGNVNPTYLLQLSTDSAAKPSTNTWTIASDERLKKDIKPFSDGLSVIKKINPIWYKYNGLGGFKEDGKENIGVLAKEIKDVAPYTVNSYMAKLYPDDTQETELLNFNSHALTFIMINSIKEQQKQIEELKLALNQNGTVINTDGEIIIASLGQSQSFKDLVASAVKEALISLTGTIATAGEWTFGKITTQKLCVEDVCVDKSQLQELLRENQSNGQPEIPNSNGQIINGNDIIQNASSYF